VPLHLPPPWGAPERDLPCERCNRSTPHYGRRVAASADDGSDRAVGEVVWLCTDCGHRREIIAEEATLKQANADDLSELFDRH
jgi:hypothetical protein